MAYVTLVTSRNTPANDAKLTLRLCREHHDACEDALRQAFTRPDPIPPQVSLYLLISALRLGFCLVLTFLSIDVPRLGAAGFGTWIVHKTDLVYSSLLLLPCSVGASDFHQAVLHEKKRLVCIYFGQIPTLPILLADTPPLRNMAKLPLLRAHGWCMCAGGFMLLTMAASRRRVEYQHSPWVAVSTLPGHR